MERRRHGLRLLLRPLERRRPWSLKSACVALLNSADGRWSDCSDLWRSTALRWLRDGHSDLRSDSDLRLLPLPPGPPHVDAKAKGVHVARGDAGRQ